MVARKDVLPVIEKIPDDEPVFVLRGQDATAPATVLTWIRMNLETAPEEKLREAFDCCLDMLEWPKRKFPD